MISPFSANLGDLDVEKRKTKTPRTRWIAEEEKTGIAGTSRRASGMRKTRSHYAASALTLRRAQHEGLILSLSKDEASRS
jgi:hypothetical protein